MMHAPENDPAQLDMKPWKRPSRQLASRKWQAVEIFASTEHSRVREGGPQSSWPQSSGQQATPLAVDMRAVGMSLSC